MEEIKALFFDIDGTIVEFQSNRIRKEVVQAISKAHENGYKVGIASSRPLTIINDIENIWNIPWDGIVAGSGTIVYDQNKEIYKNHSFSKKTLQKIFAIAQENDIAMYVCGEEAYFTKWNTFTQWLKKTYHVQSNTIHPYQGEFVQLLTLLSDNPNQLRQLYASLDETRIVKAGLYNSDIFPKSINKCSGIHELMDLWHFPNQAYMCFGDTPGDHDMIIDATIGIAMNSGLEETKQLADYVCQDIPEALKHFQIIA